MLFQRDFGVVNWVLSLVGVDAIDWDAQRWSSWTAIASMVDWRWTGYNTLILLAGMQAIPQGPVRGGGDRRRRPVAAVLADHPAHAHARRSCSWSSCRRSAGLQLFTEPLVFGNGNMRGGTQREFQTLAMYMFEKGINNLNTAGYGAAIAWALFLMIAVVAVDQLRARPPSVK